MNTLLDRLAVCSWSLQPQSPHQLINQMQQIGLDRLQIALDPIRENESVWGSFAELASKAGLVLLSENS